MKTLVSTDYGYSDLVDVMYIHLDGNGSLSVCDTIEDTPSGITVMYDKEGTPCGVEVCDYSEKSKGSNKVMVDSRTPFIVELA